MVDPQETIFPENVGSLDKPFAQNQKSRRIYVDQNYRVTRRDEGGNEYRYSYNEDGTIKRVLEYIPMFNVENVKDYKYYKTGELHMAGPAYTITESEMSYNPSTGRMDIFPGKITKHLFDGTRPVKSWHTRPYNYGKREEYVLIETTTYSPKINFEKVNYFINTYDEKGLVVFSKMPLTGGGVFNTIYYYEAR